MIVRLNFSKCTKKCGLVRKHELYRYSDERPIFQNISSIFVNQKISKKNMVLSENMNFTEILMNVLFFKIIQVFLSITRFRKKKCGLVRNHEL